MHEITKGKLGERVYRILNAGKDVTENRVKIQDCMLAVAQARDAVLVEALTDKITQSNYRFDILTEEEVEVVEDNGKKTATLSSKVLSLISNSSGIFAVYPVDSIQDEVIPTSSNFVRLYARQAAGNMEGKSYYTPIGQELRLYNYEGTCPLLVQYVKAGEYFEEDELFKIPAAFQDMVVERAIQVLSVQKSEEDPITDAKNP